jgi:hypothetical protein
VSKLTELARQVAELGGRVGLRPLAVARLGVFRLERRDVHGRGVRRNVLAESCIGAAPAQERGELPRDTAAGGVQQRILIEVNRQVGAIVVATPVQAAKKSWRQNAWRRQRHERR